MVITPPKEDKSRQSQEFQEILSNNEMAMSPSEFDENPYSPEIIEVGSKIKTNKPNNKKNMKESDEPSKKKKKYENTFLQELIKMVKKIQTLNDLRKIKDSLVTCSVNDIDTFCTSIDTPETLPGFFCQWDHQSLEEAFISNIFFPIELEEPNDTRNYLYEKERIHKKLSICVKNKHPLSMLHAFNVINQYFMDDENNIPECSMKLLDDCKKYFEAQKSKKDSINFEMGQMCHLLEENPMEYYEKSQDFRCLYGVAVQKKDVELFRKIKNDYPPSNIFLGNHEQDSDKALKFFIEAGENYVPFGYFEAGSLLLKQRNTEKALEYFQKASEKAMSSAYIILGQYYHDISDYKREKEIYLKAGKNDVPFAYIKLGNMYKMKNKNIAKKYYEKDTLGGYKYSIALEENGEKEIVSAIEKLKKYFEKLFS